MGRWGWRRGRTYLSIKAIRGDIKPAAHPALRASLPRRRGRLCVFHDLFVASGGLDFERVSLSRCDAAEGCDEEEVVVVDDAIGGIFGLSIYAIIVWKNAWIYILKQAAKRTSFESRRWVRDAFRPCLIFVCRAQTRPCFSVSEQ